MKTWEASNGTLLHALVTSFLERTTFATVIKRFTDDSHESWELLAETLKLALARSIQDQGKEKAPVDEMLRKKAMLEALTTRAQDVRRLKICVICKGLGLHEDMAGFDGGTLVHLSCYLTEFGEDKLLKLPVEDLFKVKIGTVPIATAKKILKEIERRG